MLSSCVRRSLISCSTSGGANSGEPGVAGVPPSTLSLRFNCVRRVFSNATWSWLNSRKLIWYRRETPSVRLSIFNCSSAWRTCSLERESRRSFNEFRIVRRFDSASFIVAERSLRCSVSEANAPSRSARCPVCFSMADSAVRDSSACVVSRFSKLIISAWRAAIASASSASRALIGLDLSGQRSLLRANLGLLLFALLQFSRKKKNSVVAIGFFTLHRFVISTGFFQLAARFFQRCSGVVAFVKQSVPLLADLRTLPVQVRHSRFAFE